MQAYSRRVPSGERLPGVLWPWAGSRRMSMALRRQLGDSGGEGREFHNNIHYFCNDFATN